MVGTEAPSIRLKALRLPPSSRIATFSLTPSSVALATAAFTIFCASSDEILCFFTTLAIGHLPPLDMYSVLILLYLVTFDLTTGTCSSVHSAIDRKIRPGNVGGLRTGDERHQGGGLINAPIAVESCGGLLRHRPIARRGIQVRIDRTRLYVVDCDTPTPDLSGQSLSKHLHGSLRGRVGYQPGRLDTFAHGRADRDDATAALHVPERRLRCGQCAPDVDVDHAIHLLARRLLERFRNGRAGIVHQHIKLPEGRDGLFDRAVDSFDVGSVRLYRDRLSAIESNRFDHIGSRAGVLHVGDSHNRSIYGQALRDCGADAARPASDERNLACQPSFMIVAHVFPFHYLHCCLSRSLRKTCSEHWSFTLRLFFGHFILNDIPMFDQKVVLDTNNVCGNPIHRSTEVAKSPVNDHEVTLGDDRSRFVPQRGWN